MKTNIWHKLNNAQLIHLLTSGMHDSKQAYVLKADTLNTHGKLICVHKEIASAVNIYCN